MEGYFLIARNRKTNSFQVLKLRESWFLGKENGRDDVLTRENNLEAIDLVTTRFSSEQEMAERMAMNGYISDSDVDIFIASRREKDGKAYIKFDEVLYNPKKDTRISSLRRIAYSSLRSGFDPARDELSGIYDEMIALAYFADDFYTMLMDGDTNVPRRFIEQLRGIQEAEEIPYYLKKVPGFGAKDYATTRNIVEAINRLERLSTSHREERLALNDAFIQRNLGDRMAIVPDLSIQLDKDYVEGQLSLFSLLDEEGKEQVREATKAVAAEEKKAPEKIVIQRNLSKEEKRKAIFHFLRTLPASPFYRDSDGKFKVDYSVFTQPFLDGEQKKLDTYLTGQLPMFFADFIRDYRTLCRCQNDGFTPYSEIAEIQTDVEYRTRRIDARLKSSKCLNMVYEWCMLYDGCIKREANHTESGIGTATEEKPKVYGKKPE